MEKQQRRLSLSEVDVMVAMSKTGINRRSAQSGGVIGATVVVGVVVGKG